MKRIRQIDTDRIPGTQTSIDSDEKEGQLQRLWKREIDEDRLRNRQRTILFYRLSCAGKWKHNLFKSVRHHSKKDEVSIV